MPVFAQLICDEKVQVGDKIRFSGEKSFVSGTTAITIMTLKPEDDIAALSIFNSDPSSRYLDWVYLNFEMDIDSTNNKINFTEGSTLYTAELTAGTYTLSTLATEIKTQLDAEGALIYTVTVSDNDEITITATGTFDLNPSSDNILEQLGFRVRGDETLKGRTTYTGKRVRYLTRKVTLTATNAAPLSGTATRYIKVYSEDGDSLFSTDADLLAHEPSILNYLPPDRASFKFVHRRAQELILAWLDERGYTDVYRDKLLLDAIVNIDEVAEWSKFLTLRLLFEGFSNAVDDVFAQKAKIYEGHEKNARNRVVLRLDLDGDGDVDANSHEAISVQTISAARR